MADEHQEESARARLRSSSSASSEGGPPEITLDALSADTLAALKAHLAVKDADEVRTMLRCVRSLSVSSVHATREHSKH